MTTLDQLAALAEAATPGPWHSEVEFGGCWVVTGGPNDYAVHPATDPMPGVVLGGSYSGAADAAYIAAAHPRTVAALIAAARAAADLEAVPSSRHLRSALNTALAALEETHP